MAGSSGASRQRRGEDAGVLEGSWVWIALPVGILVLIAALWFLVIAPSGSPPPRAVTIPGEDPTEWPTVTPMVITVPTSAPSPESPTAAPPAAIAVGTRVVVAGTGVYQMRIRQTPGTDAVTLKMVSDGTQFVVVGGPEGASGYTWWKLDDQAGLVGWGVQDYIKPAP